MLEAPRKPILLGSAPRSGSTFVMHILNHHPQIALSYENDLLGVMGKVFRKGEKGRVGDRWLTPREKFTYGDLFSSVFQWEAGIPSLLEGLYRPIFPKKHWHSPMWVGDKWHIFNPETLRLIEKYRFRVIWITRNPVDMVASTLERKRHEEHLRDSPESALAAWYAAFSVVQKGLPVKVLHLQYEDIILRPATAFRMIAEWLGLSDSGILIEKATSLRETDLHHWTGLERGVASWLLSHPCVNEYKMFLKKTGYAPESLSSLSALEKEL